MLQFGGGSYCITTHPPFFFFFFFEKILKTKNFMIKWHNAVYERSKVCVCDIEHIIYKSC